MRFRILVMSVVAGGAASLIGCAQATARSGADSRFALGTYRFEESSRGDASRISGTVALLPDSATIALKEGYCQPIRRLDGSDVDVVFNCDGAASVSQMCISIDRRRPEKASGWSGIVPASPTATVATGMYPVSRSLECGGLVMLATTSKQIGGQLRLVRGDSIASSGGRAAPPL